MASKGSGIDAGHTTILNGDAGVKQRTSRIDDEPKVHSQSADSGESSRSRESSLSRAESPITNATITSSASGSTSVAHRSAGNPGHVAFPTSSGTTVQYVGAASLASNVSPDGTITLKPIPSRKDRKVKVKRVVQFTPRISHFDRDSPTSRKDTFRGFYVLFWMLMGLAMLRMLYHSYIQSGEVVGLRFAKLITDDAIELAISDAILVGSTLICVPYVKAMEKGYIRYNYTGAILQHIGQTLYLATAVRWTFYRNWYWVQSGYLTLHSLTMLMKVHSYLAYNGTLSEKRRSLGSKQKKLDEAVKAAGGWQKVLAKAEQEHLMANVAAAAGSQEPASPTKPSLVQRRRQSSTGKRTPGLLELPLEGKADKDPKKLLEFSDDKIWNLAHDCVDLQEELTSTGKEAIVWPANVTFANYFDYLLVPTLVYELEYPRTSSIRPLYVLERVLALCGTFFVMYAVTEHIIFPTHEAAKANPATRNNFFINSLDLVLPFMINYLLIFYIIFECVCNGFAELSRFADRGFYDDWWNSVTWDEFARKWNKPVHQFLLRHVYASTITAFKLSKLQATFLTFLLSSAVHELVMVIVSKKFRMYLFFMQLMQLPMMALGRLPLLRKYPILGNIFFHFGLLLGFPILATGYLYF